MDEVELRARLEKALRWQIPDVVWDRFRGFEGAIQNYFEGRLEEGGEQANFRSLKGIFAQERSYLEAYEQERTGNSLEEHAGLHDTPSVELEGDRYLHVRETARAGAIAEYLATLAGSNQNLIRFRDEVLEGQLLVPEQAQSLLESPAAGYFPFRWFKEWNIPIIGHEARTMGRYDPGWDRPEVDHRVTVWLDPPGTAKRVRYAHPDAAVSDADHIDATAYFGREDMVAASRGANLIYSDADGYVHTKTVWPGSVLDNLRQVASSLAEIHHWEQAAAACFVLTGAPPRRTPLKIGWGLNARLGFDGGIATLPRWTITITAEPWVSAEDIQRAYHHLQSYLSRGAVVRGGARPFEVAAFVWKQTRLEGRRPSWPVLFERWNQQYPEKSFKTYNNFRQYFMRGAKPIVQPQFKVPSSVMASD